MPMDSVAGTVVNSGVVAPTVTRLVADLPRLSVIVTVALPATRPLTVKLVVPAP